MRILICVDLQTDFITGSLGTPEAKAIVPKVIEKIRQAHDNHFIILTKDTHDSDYLNTLEGKNLPIEHCQIGTIGYTLNGYIVNEVLYKHGKLFNKNTFGSVDMCQYIKNILLPSWGGIESIELCGLCTGICVISNALMLKAYFPEVPIRVDAAACACVTPESHLRALEVMKGCQIEVINE